MRFSLELILVASISTVGCASVDLPVVTDPPPITISPYAVSGQLPACNAITVPAAGGGPPAVIVLCQPLAGVPLVDPTTPTPSNPNPGVLPPAPESPTTPTPSNPNPGVLPLAPESPTTPTPGYPNPGVSPPPGG
jgi:hypothetical protein